MESVKNMVKASLESSLEVSVNARLVGQPDDKNEFNSATRSDLKFLEEEDEQCAVARILLDSS